MKLRIKASVWKELRALPRDTRKRIIKAARKLRNDPRPPGCTKLKGRDGYRLRVGDYRVLYVIRDETLLVLVIKVAHRNKVYR